MKLATLRDQSPDGHLLVVSSDLRRAVSAARIAPNLLGALESWEHTAPALVALSAELARGGILDEIALDEAKLASPLPRTWQDSTARHSRATASSCSALSGRPSSTDTSHQHSR
jgi:fumarylacetoacetate (FAA) hydrolase